MNWRPVALWILVPATVVALVYRVLMLMLGVFGLGVGHTALQALIAGVVFFLSRVFLRRAESSDSPNMWKGLAGFVVTAWAIYVVFWEGTRLFMWHAALYQRWSIFAPVLVWIGCTAAVTALGLVATSVFTMVGLKMKASIGGALIIAISTVTFFAYVDAIQFDLVVSPYNKEVVKRGHIDDYSIRGYDPANYNDPVPASAHLMVRGAEVCLNAPQNGAAGYWFDLDFDNPYHQEFVAQQRRMFLDTGLRGRVRKWLVDKDYVSCQEMYGAAVCADSSAGTVVPIGPGTPSGVSGPGSSSAGSVGATRAAGSRMGPVLKRNPVRYGMLWLLLPLAALSGASALIGPGKHVLEMAVIGPVVVIVIVMLFGAWSKGHALGTIMEEVLPEVEKGVRASARVRQIGAGEEVAFGRVNLAEAVIEGDPFEICLCSPNPQVQTALAIEWGKWSLPTLEHPTNQGATHCGQLVPRANYRQRGNPALVVYNESRGGNFVSVGRVSTRPAMACPGRR